MEHYNALTRQLFFASNNVKRFKTFVAMSRVKVGLAVPVGHSVLNRESEDKRAAQKVADQPAPAVAAYQVALHLAHHAQRLQK